MLPVLCITVVDCQNCGLQITCGDCISQPGCAWCPQEVSGRKKGGRDRWKGERGKVFVDSRSLVLCLLSRPRYVHVGNSRGLYNLSVLSDWTIICSLNLRSPTLLGELIVICFGPVRA